MVIKMNDEDRMTLENIDEFLNDEGKIVTYKYLSLTFSINANKSKYLLQEYLKDKTEQEYEVVYFVGGTKTKGDQQILNFTLVKKNNLDDVKKLYDDVTTCHVYSIQKCKLKDTELLYSSDVDIIKQSLHDIHKFSEVQCQFTRRTNLQVVPKNPNPSEGNNRNGHHSEKVEKTVLTKKQHEECAEETKKPLPKGKETSTALFFGKKQASTSKEQSEGKSKKPAAKKDKPNALASAFAKGKQAAPKTNTDDISEKVCDVKKVDAEEMEVDKRDDVPVETVKEKQVNEEEEESVERKKRKRRKVVIQGSDDEDDFENFLNQSKKGESEKVKKVVPEEDDDDVVAPTPERKKPKNKRRKMERQESPLSETKVAASKDDQKINEEVMLGSEEKETSTMADLLEAKQQQQQQEANEKVPGKKRRGKRQVLKSKQFVNEEGYMVTQKIYEEESFSEASDNENDLSVEMKQKTKEAEKALEKQTKVHTKKSKTQSSLTSFFKRK